jgi:hypothetical protein
MTDVSEERTDPIFRTKDQSSVCCSLLASYLIGWIFNPEDGGSTYLRRLHSFKSQNVIGFIVIVLRIVTPRDLASGYQRFGAKYGLHHRPWRQRQHSSPKQCHIPTRLNGAITQKTIIWTMTAVKTTKHFLWSLLLLRKLHLNFVDMHSKKWGLHAKPGLTHTHTLAVMSIVSVSIPKVISHPLQNSVNAI